jgi:uncharacterized protein
MKPEKKNMSRRGFIRATCAGNASLVLSEGVTGKVLATQAANGSSSEKMPVRILGKTGVSVSVLGLGGSIDPSGYPLLLRVALNMDINYWDSSTGYGNGRNEEVIGQFFSKYAGERKRVFQVTKASGTTDPERMTGQLNLSLERMQTDRIDLYLIHMLQDPELLTPEIRKWAEQKKKEGKIKFFGFSCHSNMARMLMHASTLGWIDAAMSTYNYQLMNNDEMKRALEACTKANIGLIAMKTQGQRIGPPPKKPEERRASQPGPVEPTQGPPPGTQNQDSDQQTDDLAAVSHFMKKGYTLEQAKLKAVWEDERIATCLSEMTNLTMMKANVAAAVDGVKLSHKDMGILQNLAENYRRLYCQGCMSCESAMGSESRIPDVLRYMMYYHNYGKTDEAKRLFRELPASVKVSLSSRDYMPAERACPNKIEIGNAMRKAAQILA